MYNKILNDNYILELYKLIEKYEEENNAPAYHGKNHAINVSKYIEMILTKLGYDQEIIEDAKIAGLLHDLGCNLGKEDHELRSYDIAKEYIKSRRIKLKNKKMVLEAIKNHRNNFESDNIITRVLVLSDKLDIKADRVAPNGYNLIGMRQYQYINDINISIENGIFKVNFVIDEQANIYELTNFYFTKKVIDSIIAFAKNQNLNFCIYINNQILERG